MDKELQQNLFANYPNLFVLMHDGSANLPRSKYIPHSIQSFGVECMNGWYGIIEDACEKLESLIVQIPEEKRDQYRCTHIKEKFGCLRINLDHATDEMIEIVERALILSSKTCEYCGNTGIVRKINNWMKCLCDGHYDYRMLELKYAELRQRLRYFSNLGSKISTPHLVNLLEIWEEQDDPDRPGQKRKVLVEKVTLDTYQLKKVHEEMGFDDG